MIKNDFKIEIDNKRKLVISSVGWGASVTDAISLVDSEQH